MRSELSLANADLVDLLRATTSKGASFRFRANGFSMSPFIKDGDVVTVAPLSVSPSIFGRPVAFLRPEKKKLVIHRIVAKRGHGYFIKGDSSTKMDGLVTEENILGCVTRIERDMRTPRLGLGPERFLIALLSRRGWLEPISFGWRLIPLRIRGFIKDRL